MIRFSAPAKVHLIGEHSVVYGKPAILSAIDKRLYLTLTPSKKRVKPLDKNISKIQTAIETKVKKAYKIRRIPPYNIEIKSDFPVGSGLGASAAISATLTAALLKLFSLKAGKQQIYDIAIAGERAIHGNPSGSDLAAIIFGGTLYFRKESENLKLLHPIPLKSQPLILINSGKPIESTGQMVAKVARLNALVKKKCFDQLELLTKNLASENNDTRQIFKEANSCLTKLGVVSVKTQKLISQVEKSGGAAKITGAGGWKNGSGMILVYHPKPEKLKKLGLEIIKIKLGQEGLKSE